MLYGKIKNYFVLHVIENEIFPIYFYNYFFIPKLHVGYLKINYLISNVINFEFSYFLFLFHIHSRFYKLNPSKYVRRPSEISN